MIHLTAIFGNDHPLPVPEKFEIDEVVSKISMVVDWQTPSSIMRSFYSLCAKKNKIWSNTV